MNAAEKQKAAKQAVAGIAGGIVFALFVLIFMPVLFLMVQCGEIVTAPARLVIEANEYAKTHEAEIEAQHRADDEKARKDTTQ